MKKTALSLMVLALGASGVIVFACGGGGGETAPPNAGSSSAQTAAPPASSSVATTSTTAPVVSTATPTPPPPLVVAACKVVSGKHTLELKDDGSVVADGKAGAKFVGAELQDLTGKTLVAVAADGTIKAEDMQKSLKFNAKDEVEIEGGAKISVGDDGAVVLLGPDGKPDKDSKKMKFTGFKPTARRAVTVLVLGMLMSSPTPKTSPSASVAASAAPPPTKK
jgi:hypothetical protein